MIDKEENIEQSSDHPYDSPIEDAFAWECQKYLRNDICFESQVEIITKHGKFRVDFVLSTNDYKVAVECDGKDFHDAHRDEIRDAIILGEGHLGIIYHFRGCDLTWATTECVWLMSVIDPIIFSRRGIIQLEYLNRLKIIMDDDLVNRELISGDVELNDDERYRFRAYRTTARTNPNLNYHWKALYKFACNNPGLTLDELYDKDVEEMREAGNMGNDEG